jgi:pyrroline-5-carboxylate reductase
MGEALLSRLLLQDIYQADQVWVSDPLPSRRQALTQQYGIHTTDDNSVIVQEVDVLLLAIKPQVFHAVTQSLSTRRTEQVVLSILAGTSLSALEAAFPNQPVIRAMPNTPATVGAGVTAIAPGKYVQPSHLEQARKIFSAVGTVVDVSESLMDAVTGLSGSGPGYVAVMIEALADGGVAAGLPRAIAQQLALQTVLGTAELLQQSGMHPAELKDRVTSPGGTTIAGIAALEAGGLRSAVIQAVQAACQRSKELGR